MNKPLNTNSYSIKMANAEHAREIVESETIT